MKKRPAKKKSKPEKPTPAGPSFQELLEIGFKRTAVEVFEIMQRLPAGSAPAVGQESVPSLEELLWLFDHHDTHVGDQDIESIKKLHEEVVGGLLGVRKAVLRKSLFTDQEAAQIFSRAHGSELHRNLCGVGATWIIEHGLMPQWTGASYPGDSYRWDVASMESPPTLFVEAGNTQAKKIIEVTEVGRKVLIVPYDYFSDGVGWVFSRVRRPEGYGQPDLLAAKELLRGLL